MAKNKKNTDPNFIGSSTWNIMPASERQILALHRIADAISFVGMVMAVGMFVYALIRLITL